MLLIELIDVYLSYSSNNSKSLITRECRFKSHIIQYSGELVFFKYLILHKIPKIYVGIIDVRDIWKRILTLILNYRPTNKKSVASN